MCRAYSIPSRISFVVVHRERGGGFTHFDSMDCGCKPHVIPSTDYRPVPVIVAELEARERSSREDCACS
jgi:hypothetical protein